MSAWKKTNWGWVALRFAILMVAALILGWWAGAVAWVLLLAMTVLVGWHFYHLYRMDEWTTRTRKHLPNAPGVWGVVMRRVSWRDRHQRDRNRQLRAWLRAFRQAARSLPDAVIMLSKEGNLLWFNNAAHELLGVQAPQDFGHPITNLLRQPEFSRWLQRHQKSVIKPQSLTIHAAQDAQQRLLFQLIPYTGKQNLLLVRDVSQLSRLQTVRQDFVSNVSHELRTPLTVVNGYLEAMEADISDDWAPVLSQMRQQTVRMQSIVEDLLTLAKIETSERAPSTEYVDVERLIRNVREEGEALSQGRHSIHADSGEGGFILGEENELYSAFSNLVSNAVRYTPENQDIYISWTITELGAEYTVRDTGEGIASEHLDRITERFYRVSADRSRESGGTGLGLAIVKHILVRHQAKLEITSEIGKGSTFRCVFPSSRIAPEYSPKSSQQSQA